jgi:ABC-type lipoprotein release transport system permease subunit
METDSFNNEFNRNNRDSFLRFSLWLYLFMYSISWIFTATVFHISSTFHKELNTQIIVFWDMLPFSLLQRY